MSRLLIGLLLVAGCAAPVHVVRQDVAIPIPCRIPAIAVPSWPVDSLPPTADLFEISRAMWATLELHEGYEAELRAAAKACE